MRKIPLGNLNSNNPIKTPVKKYHASVARQSPRERNRLLACKNFAFTHANVHKNGAEYIYTESGIFKQKRYLSFYHQVFPPK